MEAIILAGGFGTRRSHIVQDVPKPMAPMNDVGTPFLKLVLDEIKKQGVTKVVFSTGYKSKVIEQYFGKKYDGMSFAYSVEKEPLFTGGAVKKALTLCDEDNVFVVNGDTYFSVDLKEMLKCHKTHKADFSLVVKELQNFDRYGTVIFDDDGRVKAFREKQNTIKGYINGGVYCLKRELLRDFPEEKFSLEKDFMEKFLTEKKFYAYISEGYFIDIGIPENYYRAQKELIKKV